MEEKGFFGGNPEGTCSFFWLELGLEEERKGGGEDARESSLSLGLEERPDFRMGEVLRSSSSEDQEADMGSLSGEFWGREEAVDAGASSPTVKLLSGWLYMLLVSCTSAIAEGKDCILSYCV